MGTSQSPYPGAIGGAVSQSGNWTFGLYAPALRTDNYTAAPTTGVTVAATYPVKFFAVQVSIPSGSITSWTVLLEGSVDNSNFTTLLTHNSTIGSTIFLTSASPVLFYRTRCTALSLNTAPSINAYCIGVQ